MRTPLESAAEKIERPGLLILLKIAVQNANANVIKWKIIPVQKWII